MLPFSRRKAHSKQRWVTLVLGVLSRDWLAHLKSHLGQEGELVFLKERLAGVEEGGVGYALHERRDARLRVLHLVRLRDSSMEQRVESLGKAKCR